jgi:Stigma-specific protein, Stig1
MDGERFDAMTRALATAANRRSLFKGAALALGALAPFSRSRLALANATCGIACTGDADCANSQDDCFSCCGGVCTNTASDVSNCSACGTVCAGGQYAVCGDAICSIHCPGGFTPCGDGSYCADLANDPQNCISCGNVCPGGQTCCGAVGCIDLTIDLHNCGACGTDCGIGGRCCGSACVDPNSDAGNCGDCGVACAGDQRCQGGACVARCPAGQLFCDPNCVDLGSDAGNCGACGNACGGGQVCQGGACVSTCAAGATACGNSCVDLSSDAGNCGTCGNACGGGQTCQGGACVSICPDGQTVCGGACVDLSSDAGNCGACGTACDGAQRCQGGACVSTCAAGQTDCSGTCVDLTSDRNNCGACGTACSRDTSCVSGACIRPQCPKGQTQCQDGCVDLKTDANHCGGCNNVCLNSDFACCGGACFDLKTDPKHCGRCDFACPPGYACDGKGCVLQGSGTGSAGGSWAADPEFCVTKARTQAELGALLSPAAASSPTPTGTPLPGASWKKIVKGAKIKATVAPAALAQTIANTVVQVSACGSANDPARQTALMTDAMAARWLAERGFTPDQLTALGQTTPVPLPPQSWAQIATIDQVFELGKNVVNALVTYAPLSSAVPARSEIQVFTKHKSGWRLNAIQRADQFTAKTGALALRLFDCPAGVTPYDPAGACAPAGELQFGYEIASADGKVRKSLADAEFLDAGLLLWKDLPPGAYGVSVSVPSGSGVTTVITGDRAAANRPVFIVPSGRDAIIVDVFHERTAISDIILHLQVDAHCGPCSRQDPIRSICVPTCPPCSTCSSVARADGKSISFCRSACAADQVCQFDDRFPGDAKCCVPTGGTCTTAVHCCEGSCQKGVCACAPGGAQCAPGDCCAGSTCAQRGMCISCKPVGLACASSAECCGNSCFDGVCRCCAGVENNDFTKTHLCCEFPYALMEINDGPLGPGFKRCCAIGVDCIGDPLGPPLRSDNYGFNWAPVDCGPAAAPGQVCVNNEPMCAIQGGPACCDPSPHSGNMTCMTPSAQFKGDVRCVPAFLCPGAGTGASIDPATRVCVCADGRGACPRRDLAVGDAEYGTRCCPAGASCLPVQNRGDLEHYDDGYSSECCPDGTLAFWDQLHLPGGGSSNSVGCIPLNDPRICGAHLCDAGQACVNGVCA